MDLNDTDFGKEVLNSEEPVLIDFWAPWCGPCRAIAPIVEELEKDYGSNVKFYKMNVDMNPMTPSQIGIRSIPTLVIFKEGEIKEFLVGLRSKTDIEETLKKVI